jgi:hypothetical protein
MLTSKLTALACGPSLYVNTLAGYVRVSANTYAYGLRRGFALLVTGATL